MQEQEKALSKEAFNQMVARLQEEERDFITNVVSPTQQQITLRSGQTYQKVLSIIEYGANKYRKEEGFDFYCISPLEGNEEFDATQAIADLLNKEYDEKQKADLKAKQNKLPEAAAAA